MEPAMNPSSVRTPAECVGHLWPGHFRCLPVRQESEPMKDSWLVPSILLGIVAVVMVCACLALVGVAGIGVFINQTSGNPPEPFYSDPTSTPVVIRPTVSAD